MQGVLSDTCTVRRPTFERTSTGATKPVKVGGLDPLIASAVPCRVELIDQDPSDQRLLTEAERHEAATHNVFFRHDANVQEGDTIEVTGATAGVLRVVGLSDRQTDGYLLQANARERN